MRSLRTLPPLVALLAAGCNLNAPKQYLVPDLRVLAARAQVLPALTAAADPQIGADSLGNPAGGDAVQLEALVANPRNRTVPTIEWYTCNPPTLAVPVPPCFDDAWLQRPDRFAAATAADGVYALGTTNPVTLDLSTAPEALRRALLTAFTDRLVLMGGKADCDFYAPLQIVIVARAEGLTEVAVKRVRVVPDAALRGALPTDHYLINFNPVRKTVQANPALLDTCEGGVPLDVTCAIDTDCGSVGTCGPDNRCALPPPSKPGGALTFCASASDTTQSPPLCPVDGSPPTEFVPETLEWQWYLSAGEIGGAGFDGNVVGDDIDLTPPAAPFTLWAILRDGRGGTDWMVRDFPAP